MTLSVYDIDFRVVPGKDIPHADALSRQEKPPAPPNHPDAVLVIKKNEHKDDIAKFGHRDDIANFGVAIMHIADNSDIKLMFKVKTTAYETDSLSPTEHFVADAIHSSFTTNDIETFHAQEPLDDHEIGTITTPVAKQSEQRPIVEPWYNMLNPVPDWLRRLRPLTVFTACYSLSTTSFLQDVNTQIVGGL